MESGAKSHQLEPGASASVSLTVAENDTARSLRSGTVEVLGTPRLLALCEQASVEAIEARMPAGSTSVGVQVMLDHVMPTPVGGRVWADATLEKVKGRKLYFTTSAHDERGLIAAGKVVRVVVDEQKFLDKCN